MHQPPIVLAIAGSDSGGGAGIQADLKTFAARRCFGVSAITALTAQNTQGVQGILPIDPSFLQAQLDAIGEDFKLDAIKLGMLHSREVIEVVRDFLLKHQEVPVVLDPVMVATSGDVLLQEAAIESLKTQLFPLADIVTPNLDELQILLGGIKIANLEELKKAAEDFYAQFSTNIVAKGGHLPLSQSADLCCIDGTIFELAYHKIDTKNTHGTGCSFASCLAAELASGHSLFEAVSLARNFIATGLQQAAKWKLGKGSGPISHFP